MTETSSNSAIEPVGGEVPPELQLQQSVGRMILSSVFVALSMLVVIYIAAVASFGGLSAAASWINGSPIHIDQTVSVVNVKSGESITIPIAVRRLTSEPISIVGATAGCGCVSVLNLPLRLTNDVHDLQLRYEASTITSPDFDQQQVQLHLSIDSPPVVLSIEAHISP